VNLPLLDCPAMERPSGVWDYISPSRLNTWLRCPLAFKLRYIDGIRTPTTPALFVGKMTHQGLEVLYRHRQLCIDLSAEDVAARMVDGWDETVDTEHTADTPETPLAVETSMEAPLVDPGTGEELGISLLGIVDLITDSRDGPSIIDFKTSARSSPPHEITHEIQLSSYSYLFRRASGDEEGGLEIRSLIKTKKPKIEFHEYQARTAVHFRRLFSVIRAYLDDLDTGRFVFRPGFACSMCNFRSDSCRRWGG
jgi:putative RecB family exonuclease